MRDRTQRDARVVVVRLELLDHVTDAALQDVVAQVDAERVPSHELAGARDRVGDPLRRPLDQIRELDAIPRAVAEELADFLRHVVAEDDPDVRDPRVVQVLDAVQDVRLVHEREELLGPGVGEGPQVRAVAARQDDALHSVSLMSSSASRKVGDLLSRNRSTLPTSRDESDGRRARSSASASRAAFRSPFSRPNTSQISRPISKRVGYDRVATWKIPVARICIATHIASPSSMTR